MSSLRFVDATNEEHFAAMSQIHALGWRDTYADALPPDWMSANITDDRWIPLFRENHRSGCCRGLLLYRDSTPVGCITYGPARHEGYEGWGEIISFYVHPNERSLGYGGMLMGKALRRLAEAGHQNAYVFVLRENEKARHFYTCHGFSHNGTMMEIPFPPDTICVDLRYTRSLP